MSVYTPYSTSYEHIKTLTHMLQSSELVEAKKYMETIPTDNEWQRSNEKLLERYFLDTIQQYIEKKAWKVSNLYLIEDNNEQIKLFNLMSKEFILVTEAQKLVNSLIKEQLYLNAERSDSVSILDIGIGSGQQIANVLSSWQSEGRDFPEIIYIYGIEPSLESLNVARQRFCHLSLEYGFKLDFIPFHMTIEDMTIENWANIREMLESTGSELVINASFSLHHIPIKARDTVFHRLNKLQANLFTYIEPYADYITDDLTVKFKNAWRHYDLTFQVIDEMAISPEEKLAIKTKFFGREIQDIFSKNSIELYETAEMWSSRLKNKGFSPYGQNESLQNELTLDSRLDYTYGPGYLTLGAQKSPIVTVGSVC